MFCCSFCCLFSGNICCDETFFIEVTSAKVKKVMLKSLINELSVKYSVKYNDKVDLLTIRHYADHQFPNKLKNKEILIKQRSRSTLRYVLR